MPAKSSSGGESKGIIITLVFFVLLSIGLGVLSYYGYNEQAELKQKAEDLKNKELKTMEAERDYHRGLARQLKDYLGVLPPTERKALGQDRKTIQPKLEKTDKDIVDTLDRTRGWQPDPVNQSKLDYAAEAAQLTAAKTKLETDVRDLTLKANAAAVAAAKAGTELEAEKTNNRNAMIALADKVNKEADAKYSQRIGQLENQVGELSKKAGDFEKLANDNQIKIDKLEAERNAAEKKQQDAAKLNVKRVDLLSAEQPRGEVFAVDRVGDSVTLKLESTRNLPLQQTFSVRAVGPTGKALPNVKASLQVTRVVDEHLARARVTEVKDPGRDPIMRGDQVFTLGWNPNVRQHVAIAGVIDITGGSKEGIAFLVRNPVEGMRKVDDFRRSLERQGMIVDAYLDLRDMKVKGQVTIETDYLIVGEYPENVISGIGREKDDKDKVTVSDAVGAITKDATTKGVTIVPIRKFLAMSGYKLPHMPSEDAVGTDYRSPAPAPSTPAPPAPQAPAEKPATDKPADKPAADKPADKKPDEKK